MFVNFVGTQVLDVLNKLQTAKNFTQADVQSYSAVVANELLGIYAQQVWN